MENNTTKTREEMLEEVYDLISRLDIHQLEKALAEALKVK